MPQQPARSFTLPSHSTRSSDSFTSFIKKLSGPTNYATPSQKSQRTEEQVCPASDFDCSFTYSSATSVRNSSANWNRVTDCYSVKQVTFSSGSSSCSKDCSRLLRLPSTNHSAWSWLRSFEKTKKLRKCTCCRSTNSASSSIIRADSSEWQSAPTVWSSSTVWNPSIDRGLLRKRMRRKFQISKESPTECRPTCTTGRHCCCTLQKICVGRMRHWP